MHASTLTALDNYARTRDRICPPTTAPSFFVSMAGTRLIYQLVQQNFRRLCDDTGIGDEAERPPRIHNLRPTFAVRTLLGWHRAGEDVEARLQTLSTYLGASRSALQLLVYVRAARTARTGRRSARAVAGGEPMSPIAPTPQSFFIDRLAKQRRVSPRTIASFRDSLKLLFVFVRRKPARSPAP